MPKREHKRYAACEAALKRAQHHLDANQIALNYILRRDFGLLRRGAYSARVCGPCRADGGFVVVTYKHPGQLDSSAAYYLEEWLEDLRRDCFPNDKDGRDYRQLMLDVQAYRNEQWTKERKQAS